MKPELALRLLRSVLDYENWTDEEVELLFRTLRITAEYKYNEYEMYQPGRLFLENLYLWLSQFNKEEVRRALEFISQDLIFISRKEFQQLAHILYHDAIRRQLLGLAAKDCGLPDYKIAEICQSKEFKHIQRASLYAGMSDGARIDYFRRQTLEIDNEQILPYYQVDKSKIDDMVEDLRRRLSDPHAKFRCLFLVDEFCGSGRTLLREVICLNTPELPSDFAIPLRWKSQLRYHRNKNELEYLYSGPLSESDVGALNTICSAESYKSSINEIAERSKNGVTLLKGSLMRVAGSSILGGLSDNVHIFFCPLLITEYAFERLKSLIKRLQFPFSETTILPGAVIPKSVRIGPGTHFISSLCESYYKEEMEDEHTGPVKYGYDNCGLPIVFHHNTPNNSIYLLWCRKVSFEPLFIRYERHGREIF